LPVAFARSDLAPLLPHWKWIVVYTFVEVAAPWFFLSDAERRISSSLSGLLIALVPSIGAILAWATGSDDRLDLRRIVGLGLGFLGVAALVGLDVGAGDIGAVGEVALVALGYALGALIIGQKLQGLPLFGVVASSLALTMVAYAPVGIAQLPRSLPSTEVIAAVVVLGVICTALAFLIFFPLVAEVGAARATVITYVNPAVALALGVVFLKEPLTIGIVLGFVLIVLGSVLATRRAAPAKPSAALSRSPDLL
jgi:drug/metabolite transporter (DMT)-like permease